MILLPDRLRCMVTDANERFARLVLLCESVRAGRYPTMSEQERIGVALVLGHKGWLRQKGLSHPEALEQLGPRYLAVLRRVHRVVYDH